MRAVLLLPGGVYVERGKHDWPLFAQDPPDLTAKLDEGGHLSPLPKEPAALANIIEVTLVDFLLERLDRTPGATGRRGEERELPRPRDRWGRLRRDLPCCRRQDGPTRQERGADPVTLHPLHREHRLQIADHPLARDVPTLRRLRLPHRHRRRGSLGLDTFDYSFGYVANRAGGGETTAGIKATCERIQKTAASILRSFEEDEQAVA